jgi:arylsulfatase A-like enzyme
MSGARSANLVICVIDAGRADHVGCYGYPRPTTPSIDQLAKESVVFRDHFATFPSTKPSTASLFTGLYPGTHRIVERRTLDDTTFTLAKGLKAAGFRTAFFSSNAAASPEVGIGGDFEQVFVSPSARGRAKKERIGLPEDDLWRTPEGLTEVFGEWLSGARGSRFFAYCHFLPPHTPYQAPDELKALFAGDSPPTVQQRGFEFPEAAPPYGGHKPFGPRQWAALYDANMRWADGGVGEVVRLLRERDLLDNTLLIVTSDHGEAFGEHGYIYHSHAVYDEFLHVPLLIRFPGPQRLVGDVAALTQTVDLLPTVLDLYRASDPGEKVQGNSVLPLLDGRKSKLRDYVFATCAEPWPSYLVRDSAWSLILWRGGKLRALYDLRGDPAQIQNVIDGHPETAARMVDAFQEFARTQGHQLAGFLSPRAVGSVAKPPQSNLSEKTRRELRALGYVE